MEWKIGEIRQVNGVWCQCVESHSSCEGCDFKNTFNCSFAGTECSFPVRRDHTSVIFKKLEKVGEPYEFDGHIFQSYHTFEVPIFTENYATVREYGNNSKISIEIKQNKEDMEEKVQCCDNRFEIIAKAKEALLKETNIARDEQEMAVIDNILFRCWQMGWLDKYDDTKHSNSEKIGKNLKEFDLEAAKAGKPVCTRDGHKARIICFDYNGETGDYPIVALVHYNKGNKCYERVLKYTSDGLFNKYGDYQHDDDLMMLPEKKEGWVNVYKRENEYICENECNVSTGIAVYKSEGEAKRNINKNEIYVNTIKITWEE